MHVDEDLARALVAESFPAWAHLPVRQVLPGGWDNRTFRLGEELALRLPSAEGYVAAVEKEQRWLPSLALQLPLPIPAPATASALAARLRESSGSTSDRLRQLEQHGEVREEAERGNAGDRWWGCGRCSTGTARLTRARVRGGSICSSGRSRSWRGAIPDDAPHRGCGSAKSHVMVLTRRIWKEREPMKPMIISLVPVRALIGALAR